VSYRLDGRDAAALEDALRRIAATTRLGPQGPTWEEVLLEADVDEPSRALLRALMAAQAGVVAHLDTLPARARAGHLERRLGIDRLPVVPDRLVAVVEADPKRTPVTLPKGARLKAGRSAHGERNYETVEALAVLGASVIGAHAHRLTAAGDRIARHEQGLADGSVQPFGPFGSDADPEAPHELIVASDLLRFDTGLAAAVLEFSGVRIAGAVPQGSAVQQILKGLVYEVSVEGGWQKVGACPPTQSGSGSYSISLFMAAPTAAVELAGAERYALRCSLPPMATPAFPRADALTLELTAVAITAYGSFVVPQSAYANEGLLDVTGELEPFGPVPRRGARFTLRSDETFGKPLAEIAIDPAKLASTGDKGTRTLKWEHPTGTSWPSFTTAPDLSPVRPSVVSGGKPFSALTEVVGQPGRYVRARIDTGGYGWDEHEAQLRSNTEKVTKGKASEVVVTAPPVAPVLTKIQLGYTTEKRDSSSASVQLFARNALSLPVPLTASVLHPFAQEPAGRQGAFYVGLDEHATLGEVVSLYIEIDEADACDPAPRDSAISFAYDAGARGWRRLDAIDGTLGLRQSGIVRFAAPFDWADGSAAAGAPHGRWLRVETTAAGLAGSVRRLQTDAVEARYVLAPGHETDETPATPLPANAVKALAAAVPGIKKVTNPRPSAGGRGPEPDAGFAVRASGVVRHRNRAITASDIEEMLRHAFPELALVRCLAHHSRTSECAPGSVAVVAVPSGAERAPVPTVRLAADMDRYVREHATAWVDVAILCAEYVEVAVSTTAVLRRGVLAGEARAIVEADLRAFLHPLGGRRRAAGFGRPLFRSELLQFLEGHRLVEFVGEDGLDFLGPHAGLERIDVHPCRGLVAAAAEQDLKVQAAL